MTTTFHTNPREPVPWAMLAATLAMGVILGTLLTATTALLGGHLDFASQAPSALDQHMTTTLSPAQVEAQREVLEGELAAARYSEAQHLRSLMDLRDDPRWAEEEQREALAGAMQQSVALIEERRATAEEIQARLDLLP